MSILDVQQKLLDIWSSKNVDEAYQNTFLGSIQNLDDITAKQIMLNELYNSYSGKSQHDVIHHFKKYRLKYIQSLRSDLKDQT